MKVLRGITVVLVTLILAVALVPLCLLLVVNNTVLNPHFVIQNINHIDVMRAADDYLTDLVPAESAQFHEAIRMTLEQNQVWIKQQINEVILDSYAYLLTKTENWSIQIETESIANNLFDNLLSAYEQSLPFDYAESSVSERQQYIADLRSQFMAAVPDQIRITKDDVPLETWPKIQQAREIIGYIKIGYYSTIAVCGLMILSLFLLYLKIKKPFRILGILCMSEGVIGTAGFFITRLVIPQFITISEMPAFIQGYIPVWINNLLLPWGIFTICLLIIGVGFLVISFLVHDAEQTVA